MATPTVDQLLANTEEIIEAKHLRERLERGEKLRVKHGVDPTTSDLHLGYAVIYRKLKQWQDAGHTIVFLIGDFTARFGDPDGKLETRTMRSADEVELAAQSYLQQIGMILDMNKTEVRRNSEWYDAMSAEDFLKLLSHFTVQRMLERDMFTKRLKSGKEIRLQEPLYPVLQGYDSVMLKSDVTIIGSDQTFNELQARELQRAYNQQPQDLVTIPLLRGTDGKRKMSQSLGNAVGLNEPPAEMFGHIMSIPDNLIGEWFRLCTSLPETEVKILLSAMKKKELNPRDAKAQLAEAIVGLYHGRAAAQSAANEFTTVFSKKKAPAEMPELTIHGGSHKLLELLVSQHLASSRAEARRLMQQGGVKLDQVAVTDWTADVTIRDGAMLQIGPRRFYKLHVVK